uniref:tRNA (adenine(58)-N(1))-methyltransferase n=1 Tax=Pelusios castaneus TaxID=367368 RepID=A0A8C8RPR0_9SAUR
MRLSLAAWFPQWDANPPAQRGVFARRRPWRGWENTAWLAGKRAARGQVEPRPGHPGGPSSWCRAPAMLQCTRRGLSLQALGRAQPALELQRGWRRASCSQLPGSSLVVPRCREGGTAALQARHGAARAVCSGPGSPRDGEGAESEDQLGLTAIAARGADSPRQAASLGWMLRGRRGRALSPLERVSRLIPEELLSAEVRDLRRAEHGEAGQEPEDSDSPPLQPPAHGGDPQARLQGDEDCPPVSTQRTASKDIPFQAGDLILAEFRRKSYVEFRNMSNLTALGKLNSNWGAISHLEIIGKLPGQKFRTSSGFQFLIRRPSLDDFVMLMRRGPTISYPKDINAMLMLLEINPGDTVVESGTGSGGMSLFLSRAVGPQGRLISYEIRQDHHAIAKKNYRRWRAAWEIGHTGEWPDNVDFINKDISTASEDLKSITFDAVALDMLNPQIALPVVYPNLKKGGVCAVYLANITQVVDLLEGIRICNLSLLCEKIIEVTHKDWVVLPAKQKDGRLVQRVEPQQNVDEELLKKEDEELPTQDQEVVGESDVAESFSDYVKRYGSVPYIARPLPWQVGHTAFLIKLRKYMMYQDTAPDGSC